MQTDSSADRQAEGEQTPPHTEVHSEAEPWEQVGTHSLSVVRGMFRGMVRSPSPWQSTVVPLQAHRAGQALA